MRNRGTRRLGMDMMTQLFMAMVILLYIVLAFINIPEELKDVAPPPQGSMSVELYWPNDMDTDVDLWVRAEADMIPVGYSNKGGPLFNLLRDDLGGTFDISSVNQEISYSRGLPDGEYVINAHLFNLKSGHLPVPIRVVVTAKVKDTDGYTQLFTISGELKFFGEEKTMARFKMKDGVFVPESMSTAHVSIRAITEGGPQ